LGKNALSTGQKLLLLGPGSQQEGSQAAVSAYTCFSLLCAVTLPDGLLMCILMAMSVLHAEVSPLQEQYIDCQKFPFAWQGSKLLLTMVVCSANLLQYI
jgi:hypothetical protein